MSAKLSLVDLAAREDFSDSALISSATEFDSFDSAEAASGNSSQGIETKQRNSSGSTVVGRSLIAEA